MDTRRDVQLCRLQILKAVAKVCDDHGIACSLTGGSLIGAIRHKGFIPWDDDIDICMTAENYKRFCKIGQECLGSDYLQSISIISAFPIGIIMILMIGSFFKDAKKYLKEPETPPEQNREQEP